MIFEFHLSVNKAYMLHVNNLIYSGYIKKKKHLGNVVRSILYNQNIILHWRKGYIIEGMKYLKY